ncbi:DUF4383 domain-containing protein [Saccharothrix coeruleofusca]|uniref:Membrane protein n=1 Tax=Saccharothrix coeruleofusca TaxID=33919 RepID=A0A918AUA4_9PSEU|nr:DUF4383 domain-containing protein [Saccharothrix coeruleofusca]MBP2335398.1 preprotein translocase subunit Sss1 [Saccharothrix coeruleofusca]GGP77591.1 membrane protein [Saccharothrix coeruleofusca]
MTTSAGRTDVRRRPVQVFALVVGVVFLVVGVLGFIPGITTDFDQLRFAGPGSQARIFGLFEVSVLHNLVHLLFGALGLLAARRGGGARGYLVVGGFAYLLLWVYGSVIHEDSGTNFIPLNPADNLLHLFLGAGMVLLGVLGTVLERKRA